jgi:hypothetical protein
LVSHAKGRTQVLRTLENRVLRKVFGLQREEVAGGWKRLFYEQLHNLYNSSNIRVIKDDDGGGSCRTPKGRNHSENLDVNGRIILEWTLGK